MIKEGTTLIEQLMIVNKVAGIWSFALASEPAKMGFSALILTLHELGNLTFSLLPTSFLATLEIYCPRGKQIIRA